MRYSSIGRRFVAWAIDLLIMGCGIAALGDYRDVPGSRASWQVSWLGWRYVIAFLVLPVAYLVLFEWLAGATPGKFLVRVRVRTEQGRRIGLGQSVARNLARVVDAIPYLIPYLVGAVAISRSATRQRVGDRWAKTVVISSLPALEVPPRPDGVPPASRTALPPVPDTR
ncbi:MAG TPA: RDD family protein [Actinomycetota bacterium]